MKKIVLKWKLPENPNKWFSIEARGIIDGRDVIISKSTLNKLAIKFMYWHLNEFCGEEWGTAVPYVVAEEGDRRIDHFNVNHQYVCPFTDRVVEYVTKNDRYVTFYDS